MRRCIFLVITVLLAALLSTGCWDTMDISNRAFVTAIGVDKGEGTKKFKVSLEILKAFQLQVQDAKESAAFVETVNADSLALAMEEIQGRVPGLLSLAHLRVMLIGEKLARENFRDTIEFIQKNPEKALRLRLLFVKEGEAQEVLNTKPVLEKYVAGDLIAITMIENRHAMMITNPLIDLIGELRSAGGKGLGGMIAVSAEEKKISHNGGAIFDKWKLVGWLSGEETQSANWITGNANATVLVTAGGGAYAYRVDHSKVSVKPAWDNNGRLGFVVQLKTDGMILDEQKRDYDLTKPKEMDEMEKIFSREITDQINAAVRKSQQELGVDYLGFGQTLRQKNPKAYNRLDWDKVYPEIPVTVQVNASVTRFGLSP